jgi:dTDP-3-amino-3,4,6-trideoxy-alpha-D-glucose transaminase
VNIPFLDLGRQTASLRAELDAAIARVLDSGRFILGEEVESFERELAAHAGAKFAVGVGNGTQALEIALRVAGIGAEDEVITSPLTAPFTAQAILAAGARPVFADVDPATLLLDPEAAARQITPRTRAIVPVHLYGRVADLAAFRAIVRERRIEIIQDACQAYGARFRGKALTRWSRLVALSFYPTKNLGALGDAGALLTDDEGMARRIRLLRNGGVRDKAVAERYGLNSRLDEIQAAVLRAKLAHLDRWTAERRLLAAHYAARIGPPVGDLATRGEHVFHLYVVRAARREALRRYLVERGIGTAIHYPRPLHQQPAFGGSPARHRGRFPAAERACREILSLPLYPELTIEELERVCSAVRAFYGGSRSSASGR